MTNDFQLIDGVLSFPPDIKRIPDQDFAGNPEIKKLILGVGIEQIGAEAFSECENLEEAVLPEGLLSIAPAAFASCQALRKINIPSTVKSIGDGAFLFCSSLRSISLPEGLERIEELAFHGSGLERVSIPASVAYIGEQAFFECEALCRADVLGESCSIGANAFGSSERLISGYIAPGYPEEKSGPSELLYTILWCSCPERHSDETARRAERFIRAQEELIMEWVLKTDNIPAMTGLAQRALLSSACIDRSLRKALQSGRTELSALLLSMKGGLHSQEGDFDL